MAAGKVLVIDDEAIVRDVVADILQDDGYGVVTASSGAEALEQARDDGVDVALVDILLAGEDGVEVLRSLRRVDEDLQVLIVTGYPTLDTVTQTHRLGAFDYLMKPLDSDRLLLTVRNAFAARRLAVRNRQLLRDLQRANQDLERRVQERTAELAAANATLRSEIAARTQAEAELRQHHDHLEELVAARTGELAEINEALRREIAERMRGENLIKASLREKEMLLKEIHHRVKNNLQLISSLLYLQSKNVRDRQALQILRDGQSRIRSMALVHERLYESEDLAWIDFDEYVRTLADHMLQTFGVSTCGLRLEVNAQDVFLGIDKAVPCGLIVHELVSNSLKHAFRPGGKGQICIDLTRREGDISLKVSDDGVGFPPDVDFRATRSMGLQLVNTLVEQLEGTIDMRTDKGTMFQITFAEVGGGGWARALRAGSGGRART